MEKMNALMKEMLDGMHQKMMDGTNHLRQHHEIICGRLCSVHDNIIGHKLGSLKWSMYGL